MARQRGEEIYFFQERRTSVHKLPWIIVAENIGKN
jgi:hypothetical protein